MIGKLIEFIMSLFRSKPKKQKELEKNVEILDEMLEEIEDEDMSDDDIIAHFRD